MSGISVEQCYCDIEKSTANLTRIDQIIDGLLQERQLHAKVISLIEQRIVVCQDIRIKDRRIIELATKIIERKISNE